VHFGSDDGHRLAFLTIQQPPWKTIRERVAKQQNQISQIKGEEMDLNILKPTRSRRERYDIRYYQCVTVKQEKKRRYIPKRTSLNDNKQLFLLWHDQRVRVTNVYILISRVHQSTAISSAEICLTVINILRTLLGKDCWRGCHHSFMVTSSLTASFKMYY
jgi:hypothetical protein